MGGLNDTRAINRSACHSLEMLDDPFDSMSVQTGRRLQVSR